MLDSDLINLLKEIHPSNEGSLFNNPNEDSKKEQIRFITEAIKYIGPKNLLETGTDKGFFDLFILDLLPDANIITFDQWEPSEKAVSILNKRYGDRITFIKGDTNITFVNFDTKDRIDLAYIDGDHSHKGCLSDLNNCKRLNIVNILIDDYSIPSVKGAVDTFCSNNDYKIHKCTEPVDVRGIAWIIPSVNQS
jgi:hypothetical protein